MTEEAMRMREVLKHTKPMCGRDADDIAINRSVCSFNCPFTYCEWNTQPRVSKRNGGGNG